MSDAPQLRDPEAAARLEATLAAAGLDTTALHAPAPDGTVRLGWSEPAGAGRDLPLLTAGRADDLVTLDEVIGEGGMGVVHAAHQRGLERPVAVKSLRAGADHRRAAALVQEARVIGAVAHPNVLPVHMLGRDADGQPLLVMRRVAGTTWAAQLAEEARSGALDDDQLEAHLRILMQVANAVAHAHDHDVLHRDVKPDNVMLDEHGAVYLVDWGLAASIGAHAPAGLAAAAATAHVAGTPGYLAPEQAAGDGDSQGPATDVYLLGAVLYRLLAGEPPHRGSTPFERLVDALERPEPGLPANTPEDLALACRRAMAWDPAARFPTAAAFRAALADHLRRRPTQRLLLEARGQLDHLAALVEHHGAEDEVRTLFGAARFVFRQIAGDTADEPAALTGLQAAIGLMLRWELDHGRVSAAEALLAELPTPDPGLARQCAGARAAVDARAARLKHLEHMTDATFGDMVRGWLALIPSLLWLAIHLPLGWLHRRGRLDLSVTEYASFLGIFLAGCVAVLPLFRDTLLDHPINRRTAVAALTLVGIFLGILVLAAILGMPLHHAMVITSWVATCTWVVGALSIERIQLYASVVHATALVLFILYPAWMFELAGLSTCLAHGGLGVIWIRRARAARRAAATPAPPAT